MTIDYKEAARQFRAIVDSLGIKYTATPALGTDYTEEGRLHFECSLGTPGSTGHVRTPYFCGSAIPLHAYLDNPGRPSRPKIEKAASKQGRGFTLDEAAIRQAIRRAYKPPLHDVLAPFSQRSGAASKPPGNSRRHCGPRGRRASDAVSQ